MLHRSRMMLFTLLTIASLISSASTTAQSPVLDRVLKSGELRVGMTADQPPLNAKDKDGEMMGLEVDLAEGLAQALGLELKIIEMRFGQLLDALQKGKVDMVMSGVDITPERTKDFLFVGPYLISGKSLLTTSKALAKAETVDDINNRKFTFVALANSTSAAFIKRYMSKAKSIPIDNYKMGVDKVRSGEADAMIADMPACVLAVLRNPDSGLITLAEPLSVEPIGIAVSAKDPKFYNLIDNFIDAFEGTGILMELRRDWFDNGDWIEDLE
ncbi:MAG: transporter substrate-binding domain-containing protein [Myxococcales bacterium]|nr:transporter substrate-binding domain-containing protein [Myxococcales bacterium]MDH3484709.1 transporter substrate-binding domain-containing protein [Myxococcales bacterium]